MIGEMIIDAGSTLALLLLGVAEVAAVAVLVVAPTANDYQKWCVVSITSKLLEYYFNASRPAASEELRGGEL